jgi:hypothetical protein
MKAASCAVTDPVTMTAKIATLDANRKLRIGMDLHAVNIAFVDVSYCRSDCTVNAYDPELASNTVAPSSLRTGFKPPVSVAFDPGTYTVAVVFGGMVTCNDNPPPARFHELFTTP